MHTLNGPYCRQRTIILATGLVLWAALAGCKEKLPESRLDATVNVLSDQRVQVDGATTLPDGANILVTLRQPGSKQPIVQGLPVVKEHRFSTLLSPGDANVASGTYEVYVMFSPEAFAWSEEVLPAVGQKGEKLVGPQVRQKENGLRILEKTITFNYIAASPAAAPMSTSAYGYETPYGHSHAYGTAALPAQPPTHP